MHETRLSREKNAENALKDVLEYLMPGGSGEVMAHKLLRRFGSTAAVIEAGKHMLIQEGMSENDAFIVSMLPDVIRHMEKAKFGEHPELTDIFKAEKYLSMRYIGLNIERFYLMALDASGRLIEFVHMQTGDESSAPFYLKHALAEVVRTGAKYVLISHNHPNNTPRPSQADIDCTEALMNALQTLGAPLVDHIIMAGKHALSIRGLNYIPEYRWIDQNRESSLLANWLNGWDGEKVADEFFKMQNR